MSGGVLDRSGCLRLFGARHLRCRVRTQSADRQVRSIQAVGLSTSRDVDPNHQPHRHLAICHRQHQAQPLFSHRFGAFWETRTYSPIVEAAGRVRILLAQRIPRSGADHRHPGLALANLDAGAAVRDFQHCRRAAPSGAHDIVPASGCSASWPAASRACCSIAAIHLVHDARRDVRPALSFGSAARLGQQANSAPDSSAARSLLGGADKPVDHGRLRSAGRPRRRCCRSPLLRLKTFSRSCATISDSGSRRSRAALRHSPRDCWSP